LAVAQVAAIRIVNAGVPLALPGTIDSEKRAGFAASAFFLPAIADHSSPRLHRHN
jgi:hypothetical protein